MSFPSVAFFRGLTICLLLFFAGNGFAATPGEVLSLDSPVSFDQKETASLKAGKPVLTKVPNSPFRPLCPNPWIAAVLLDRDCADAAGLLMDFQLHPKIFPKLKEITIEPLGDSRYRLHSRVRAGLFQFQFTTLWTYNPAELLAAFDLDPEEKNDFQVYKGFWKFVPQKDGKTLLLYSLQTKTPGNPLPFLEDQQSRAEMTNTLEEFRKALATN